MRKPEENESTEDELVVELVKRAKDFEQQFNNPESLTPVQIFEELGFHEIDFKRLDPELQINSYVFDV